MSLPFKVDNKPVKAFIIFRTGDEYSGTYDAGTIVKKMEFPISFELNPGWRVIRDSEDPCLFSVKRTETENGTPIISEESMKPWFPRVSPAGHQCRRNDKACHEGCGSIFWKPEDYEDISKGGTFYCYGGVVPMGDAKFMPIWTRTRLEGSMDTEEFWSIWDIDEQIDIRHYTKHQKMAYMRANELNRLYSRTYQFPVPGEKEEEEEDSHLITPIKAMILICGVCGEPLKMDPQKGYVHQDGSVYKQGPDGKDHHCVKPQEAPQSE